MPSSSNTPFLETADFKRSPSFEIEDTTPRWTSLSPPAPRVRLLVNQVISDHDPCPETQTPTQRELQKARSPAPRPSFPTSSHPWFVSPVPCPPGIPPPPSTSTSASVAPCVQDRRTTPMIHLRAVSCCIAWPLHHSCRTLFSPVLCSPDGLPRCSAARSPVLPQSPN